MRRRDVLAGLGTAALAGRSALAAEKPRWMSPLLPSGAREIAVMVTLPGKQPLIQHTDRPPNYEAPIETFRNAITDNELFFVRYHEAGIPTEPDLANWSLKIGGDAAGQDMTLTRDELDRNFSQIEVTAVCQCSGNRRGLSHPHVPGVEWGYGAMGNAVWRGVRLKDVLDKAGVKAGALEVWMHGADGPVLPVTPAFHKSLPMDKARDEDTIIATSMNGKALPLLNGYPVRLIVPGWTATYWMKHLTNIEISTKPQPSYWMHTSYRVPAGMFPVDHPFKSQENDKTWPITEMVVNSVIAEPFGGSKVPAAGFTIRGVAWDRGHGIRKVEVSTDGGKSWKEAHLDKDLGRYSFRAFSLATGKLPPGPCVISARATSNAGETQAKELKFNPAGYQNNVPQMLHLTVA